MTAVEFLALPKDVLKSMELVRGNAVPRQILCFGHEVIKARMASLLMRYADEGAPGLVFCEAMFEVTGEDCRQPDVSFLSSSRLRSQDPDGGLKGGYSKLLNESADLELPDLLPGFRVPVAAFFE